MSPSYKNSGDIIIVDEKIKNIGFTRERTFDLTKYVINRIRVSGQGRITWFDLFKCVVVDNPVNGHSWQQKYNQGLKIVRSNDRVDTINYDLRISYDDINKCLNINMNLGENTLCYLYVPMDAINKIDLRENISMQRDRSQYFPGEEHLWSYVHSNLLCLSLYDKSLYTDMRHGLGNNSDRVIFSTIKIKGKNDSGANINCKESSIVSILGDKAYFDIYMFKQLYVQAKNFSTVSLSYMVQPKEGDPFYTIIMQDSSVLSGSCYPSFIKFIEKEKNKKLLSSLEGNVNPEGHNIYIADTAAKSSFVYDSPQ
jgi:hypothetical protein